jgi:transcriptional regulator with XRE-family HTH domain
MAGTSISIGGGRASPIEVTELRRARIRSAMKEADVDQSELARRVGCTPGAINQILSGLTKRSRFLPEIAIVLGVSVGWLVGDSDDPHPWPGMKPPMTADEGRLLEIYRQLPKKDRAALKTLLERMAADTASEQ